MQWESDREKPTGNCKVISWRISKRQSDCSKCHLCRWLLVRGRKCLKSFKKGRWAGNGVESWSFHSKRITFTVGDPPSALSTDDISVNVAVMKCFPKKNLLALTIGELNFAKKQRGKKPVRHQNIIPSELTRRNCVLKVAEIWRDSEVALIWLGR